MSLECVHCNERRSTAIGMWWHYKIDHQEGAATAYCSVEASIELNNYRKKRAKEEKENSSSGRATDYHDR